MNKNVAVITGANSGIGKEFAKLLSQYEDLEEIWAFARNKERLNELKTTLGEKVRPFSMDLTARDNLNAIKTLLAAEKPNVRYLVNCAGFAKFGDYGATDEAVSLNMIDLNIAALVGITLICLPYMREGAHVINMSSQASFQPVPYQNLYSSTKVFVKNYTRALNVELKERGINATAVCPGWMNTRLIERAYTGAAKATNEFPFITEPYPVAEKALKDAEANKDISVYSPMIKLSHLLSKLLPHRFVMKVWLKQQHINA